MRRLPNSAHTSRPWRIHELTRDFRLEDVWLLPRIVRDGDFVRLIGLLASFDPAQSSSSALRALIAVRLKLGDLLGWDDAGTDSGRATLRDRLPSDLRDGPSGPESVALPFTSLYLTEDEWAGEIVNRTVQGVIHVGRIQHDDGGYGAQLAILVKPNGLLGTAYMAAIKPFRYLVVYPTMLREVEQRWRTLTAS